MGCDIHFAVEKRIDGVWQRAEALVPNPWRKYDAPDDPQAELRREEWYDGRNYNIFAMLADVRMGRRWSTSCRPRSGWRVLPRPSVPVTSPLFGPSLPSTRES